MIQYSILFYDVTCSISDWSRWKIVKITTAINLHGVKLRRAIGYICFNIDSIKYSFNEIAACVLFSLSLNLFYI